MGKINLNLRINGEGFRRFRIQICFGTHLSRKCLDRTAHAPFLRHVEDRCEHYGGISGFCSTQITRVVRDLTHQQVS